MNSKGIGKTRMEKKGIKVKLLVCYHKPDVLLKDDVLTPIHVGRALARKRMKADDPRLKWLLENTIGDDTGDNISEKNDSYNELTALYWAWKNYGELGDPDYIGLMHYRRHFIFRSSDKVVETVDGIKSDYFDYINYSPEKVRELLGKCDYVAHIGRVDKVAKHYAENHHISDLQTAIKILKSKYPEYGKTADDYMEMSNVNFCNMFIMPKKMFFDYCKWLFDILGEFEKRVDISEKRLFISERLTGIYIEQMKRKGYKQISLSTTFINGETHTPVVMPLNGKSYFRTATTMTSILRHADKKAAVDFYFLSENAENVDKSILESVAAAYGNKHTVRYIDVRESAERNGVDISGSDLPEDYPVIASELLPELNKFLYIDERAIFFGDIAEFHRTCNNDEFYVIGLPGDTRADGKRSLMPGVYSIHGGRMRKHKIYELAREYMGDLSVSDTFFHVCPDYVGYLPWWLYNVTDKKKDGKLYYDRHRGDERWGVWEHPMLYYSEGMEPWANVQALYSVFWWENAGMVPASVPLDGISDDAEPLMYDQSVDICRAFGKNSPDMAPPETQRSIHEEQRPQQNIFKRFGRYYKAHGFRQTVKRIFQKIAGK